MQKGFLSAPSNTGQAFERVYRLFGLTREEIALVEKAAKHHASNDESEDD